MGINRTSLFGVGTLFSSFLGFFFFLFIFLFHLAYIEVRMKIIFLIGFLFSAMAAPAPEEKAARNATQRARELDQEPAWDETHLQEELVQAFVQAAREAADPSFHSKNDSHRQNWFFSSDDKKEGNSIVEGAKKGLGKVFKCGGEVVKGMGSKKEQEGSEEPEVDQGAVDYGTEEGLIRAALVQAAREAADPSSFHSMPNSHRQQGWWDSVTGFAKKIWKKAKKAVKGVVKGFKDCMNKDGDDN